MSRLGIKLSQINFRISADFCVLMIVEPEILKEYQKCPESLPQVFFRKLTWLSHPYDFIEQLSHLYKIIKQLCYVIWAHKTIVPTCLLVDLSKQSFFEYKPLAKKQLKLINDIERLKSSIKNIFLAWIYNCSRTLSGWLLYYWYPLDISIANLLNGSIIINYEVVLWNESYLVHAFKLLIWLIPHLPYPRDIFEFIKYID